MQARRRRPGELAPELLDLVPELRGVLEAQLLGGEVHLLLEGDDELVELVARHPLDLGGLPTPAARRRNVRGLEREELGDVRHALHDGLRRDPVLLVVGDLDRASSCVSSIAPTIASVRLSA